MLQEYDQANSCIKKAIELDPNNQDLYIVKKQIDQENRKSMEKGKKIFSNLFK